MSAKHQPRNLLAPLRLIAEWRRDRGEWQSAAKIYRLYLRNYPKDIEATVQFGHCQRQAGDFSGAKAAYQRALAIDPAHLEARAEHSRLEVLTPAKTPRSAPNLADQHFAMTSSLVEQLGLDPDHFHFPKPDIASYGWHPPEHGIVEARGPLAAIKVTLPEPPQPGGIARPLIAVLLRSRVASKAVALTVQSDSSRVVTTLHPNKVTYHIIREMAAAGPSVTIGLSAKISGYSPSDPTENLFELLGVIIAPESGLRDRIALLELLTTLLA